MWKTLLSVLPALVLTMPASAEVPRAISYQGILTDNLGAPVADGNYSLTVRFYDDAAAGTLVYTEIHPTVAVSDGGFSILIGTITPLSLAFDIPLWLSLQVGADPELSPRVALGSSPYALGLSLPFEGTADGTAPAFKIHNASGPALATDGSVQFFSGGGSTPIATIQSFSAIGGQLSMRDEAGSSVIRAEPDANGTGGFFSVSRNASSFGFTINGNDGTEEPIVSVLGSTRSAVFDMSQAGDPAISLPSSCVSSLEEWNEPGVAEVFSNGSVQIGLGVTSITSRTITAVDDGYVIAIAGGSIELGHVNGTDSRIIYGINDQSGVFAASAVASGTPSSAPTGIYRFATPWVGVWPVTAGSYTFYLLAQRFGAANGSVVIDPTITLLYVATAYGTVTGNLVAGGDLGKTADGPPTEADIAMEKAESAAFDHARMQKELDIIRQQMEALQQRFANDSNAAAAASK